MNQQFPEIHAYKDSFDEAIDEHLRLGQVYAQAKALSWKLQQLEKSILASVASQHIGSEAAKERMARCSKEYLTHIDGTCVAIERELQAKAEFDNADKEFEKLRSLCSLEKKQINLT